MYFIFNLSSPISNGNPSHKYCGEDSELLSLTNVAAKIAIQDVVILDTTNLATAVIATPLVIGSTGITLESFAINLLGSRVALNLSGINTFDEKTLSIRITKTNYFSFENSFKLFGYDLGNGTGISVGNPDLNISLISKLSNLDAYGLQMNTFSKFTAYQKPFTNKTLVYNLVGTTGEITYTNVDTTDGIGGGQNAIVCSLTGLNIKQTIIVRDKDCNIYDICESTEEVIQPIWFPPVNKSVYSDINCDSDCTSNVDTNSIELNLGYNDVTVYRIDGEDNWLFSPDVPSTSLYQQFVYELYDYNGQIIETQTVDVTTFYSVYSLNPSAIVPTTFNFTLPVFGDVVVKVKYQVLKESDDSILIECTKIQEYNSCNYWRVINGQECGDFIVKNCSLLEGGLNIYQLQADKTFVNILDNASISPMSDLNVSLDSDGVYTFVFEIKAEGYQEETFVVFNYCNFKTCYFEFLKKVLCTDICENCNKKGYYDFNSFSLNAQVFLALMNAENGFNYLYTAIDTDKIEELYTIKTFIDRLNEYCANDCGCSTCT